MNSVPVPDLAAAMAALWQRFLPEMQARVAVVEEAAVALTRDQLTAAQAEAAHAAAHKLAGSLGSFQRPRGTEVARELEQLFTAEQLPTREVVEQITALCTELKAQINAR